MVTTRGHCSGASADGSTLVLANTGAQDRFAVVRDRKVRSLRFTGTFAVDAVANDGRTRFLIESVEDGTATYAVRDVDLVTGVLAEDPVVNVDVTERGRIPASSTEGLTMRGKPIDRAEHTDDWNDTLCFGLVNRRGEDGDGIHHGDRNRTRTCMPSTAEPAAPSLCFAYTGTGVAAGRLIGVHGFRIRGDAYDANGRIM